MFICKIFFTCDITLSYINSFNVIFHFNWWNDTQYPFLLGDCVNSVLNNFIYVNNGAVAVFDLNCIDLHLKAEIKIAVSIGHPSFLPIPDCILNT